MAMALLPSVVGLLPLTLSRTTSSTSSPLSVRRPRPRALSLPRAHCCASRTPQPLAAAREAAASWAGKLAGAVPWKAAVSGVLAVAVSVSFTCRKLCFAVYFGTYRFKVLRGTLLREGGGRAKKGIAVPNCFVGLANARSGVNKPELLPKEFTTVIDVAGFLSSGQETRLRQEIEDLEKDTGYKLRVLAQNYPDTPGLAIKDFWQVDERTIVFVADPTFGNIINFNIGPLVDLDVPRSFWSQVSGKYGNMFYWKEKGEDASIEAAVTAISRCLRNPTGTNNCSEVL